jgi:TatD DNase family protein
MKENVPKEWRVHVHCFTSSLDMAKSLLDQWPNLFIGYTGVRSPHTHTHTRATNMTHDRAYSLSLSLSLVPLIR